MTLRFVFPLPINLANARMHWAVKHVRRSEYFAACDALQLAGKVPPPPRAPIERAHVHEVLRMGGHMDDDNAANRCKWPIDWLKTRGYIADDRKKNLVRSGYPRQLVKRDGDYAVEITLTALESAS